MSTPHHPPARTLMLGDIFVALGGAGVFFSSFLPFVTIDDSLQLTYKNSNLPVHWNAWASETFMAPLTWFVANAGAFAALLVLLTFFAGRARRYLSFTAAQLQLIASAFVTVVMAGYAVSTKSLYFGTEWAESISPDFASSSMSLGIGGYLMLFSGAFAALGAVLNMFGGGVAILKPTPRETIEG